MFGQQQLALQMSCYDDAVMDEYGLDIVLDPNGELKCCLSAALPQDELKKLATFAAVTDTHDKQRIRELCAIWDMDHMPQGMSQVM